MEETDSKYCPFALESRRYIGNKTKLNDWIMQIIEAETQDVHSFCDIFAGTGTVAKQALQRFDKVIVNDFLYSNNVIYKAFFGDGEWDLEKLQSYANKYNSISANSISSNYFSDNYGDKYYSFDIAKIIGAIRDDIEEKRATLTEKEYSILLASLIYSIDRLANTCGHFEAYIKKPIVSRPFLFKLVDAQSYPNVEIYQQDANLLARQISCDVVYIDPPYNSRQYSNAYHLLENLVRWQKPLLEGVAMKFKQPELKSSYCKRDAISSFSDLVSNLKARYMILSYNNMARKGNDRSNARMSDDDILCALNKRGNVLVFEKEHKAFSAGKSNVSNNKERIFLCKVK